MFPGQMNHISFFFSQVCMKMRACQQCVVQLCNSVEGVLLKLERNPTKIEFSFGRHNIQKCYWFCISLCSTCFPSTNTLFLPDNTISHSAQVTRNWFQQYSNDFQVFHWPPCFFKFKPHKTCMVYVAEFIKFLAATLNSCRQP